MATPQELAAIVREMNKGLRNLTQEHRNALQGVVDSLNGTSETGSRRESGDDRGSRRVSNESRQLEKSFKALRKEVNQNTSLLQAFARSLQQANSQASRNQNNNNQPPQDTQSDDRLSNDVSNLASEIRSLVRELRDRDDDGDGGNNNDGGGDGGGDPSRFRQWSSQLVGQLASKFSVMEGLRKGYGEVQLAASRGAIYEPGSIQLDAALMGMDTSELIEMQAEFRTSTLRATNGINQWTEEVKRAQYGLLPYTGSLHEAAKVTATLQHNLMNVGFSFEQANGIIGEGRGGLIGNLKELSAVTGDTILELSNRLNMLASSDDNRNVLRKMDRAQRADYLQTQSRLLSQYTMLTGSVDRAHEMLARQTAMTNRTAKDRFVQSMRTAQAARLSGMSEGDAQELQRLMAMNPTAVMQDDELAARLRELSGTFNQNIKTMEGSTRFATEHLGNVLARLGNASEMDVFNTETDTGIIADNAREQMDRSIGTAIEGNEILHKSFEVLQQIEASMKNVITLMVGGAVFGGLNSLLTRRAAGAAGGAGAGGPGIGAALGNLTTSIGNMLKSPKVIGGIAGGVAVASSVAVDKLWDAESSSEEKAKNATSSALEFAGYGMMIGTMVAGPVGAAVGAAVGGLAGAIVGLNETVQEQALYEAQTAKQETDASIMLLKSRHKMEVGRIQDMITLEKEKLAAAEGNDKAIHERRIASLESQIEKENELYKVKMRDAEALRSATDALLTKLTDKKNLREGFENAFGRNMYVGSKEFDPSDFMEKSGWTATDIMQSISDTMAGDISSSDFSQLQSAIMNDEDINDKRLMGILKQWRTRVTNKYREETKQLQEEQIKSFETAKMSASKSTELNDEGQVTVVDNQTDDLFINSKVDEQIRDDKPVVRMTRQQRKSKERRDRQQRQAALVEREVPIIEGSPDARMMTHTESDATYKFTKGTLSGLSPTQRKAMQERQAKIDDAKRRAFNPDLSFNGGLSSPVIDHIAEIGEAPLTTPGGTSAYGLTDYSNTLMNNMERQQAEKKKAGSSTAEGGSESSQQTATLDDLLQETKKNTMAIESFKESVGTNQRETMNMRQQAEANRSFEGNLINRSGPNMQSKAATLPK